MISDEVLTEMLPYLQGLYGNPGSLHKAGRIAKKAVDNAREQVALFINAKPDQIVFTSSGTEANNMAIKSAGTGLLYDGRSVVAVSPFEHNSSMYIPYGVQSFLSINDNNEFILPKSIEDNTFFVSAMLVNNETGQLFDLRRLSQTCKEHNIFFHTDCVQAAGYVNLDVVEIGCDTMSLSSHKIHAPKGVGALYCKDMSIVSGVIHGGENQEFGVRGGTENVAGIVGFGKACELAGKHLAANKEYIDALRDLFTVNLKLNLTKDGYYDRLHINGCCGKVVNFRIDGVFGETLLLMLDSRGVCVSAGSACNSMSSIPSHVLLAMGLTEDEARESVRVSFSKYNTKDEVLQATKVIADCVRDIINMWR